jgi:hypothetical protein
LTSVLTERVRTALAPDYELLDEIASGGMGVVYRARDVALDRLVAVKIIRPELATAVAAERFLREARALASVSHPGIVPVYRAAESGGLSFYVMEYVEGETLATRLTRGPLPRAEALRLADDLLAAVGAVHAHGIIHRDIKPHNIFMTGARAMLGDFGIAKSQASGDTSAITRTGDSPGTPAYMPPEQRERGECTERTDLCAAAMVIFEAFTGRRWAFDPHNGRADWTGVPRGVVPALRRALAWSSMDRWPDAAAFRRALHGRGFTAGRIAVAGSMLLAVLILWYAWPRTATGMFRVRLQRFSASDAATSPLADSLTIQVRRALQGAADIVIDTASGSDVDVTVSGAVTGSHDSASISLRGAGSTGAGLAFERTIAGPRASVADSVALQLLLALWESRDPAFGDLPVDAMPHAPAAMLLWGKAEALYAQGRWPDAYRAYGEAARDSTCTLCGLRQLTIARWLRIDADTAVSHRVARGRASFPEHYRAILRASMNERDRWTELAQLVRRYPRFDMGHFIYGDELFHRGPLAGWSRSMAMDQFSELVTLRPTFAPGWEHLAWVAIAEGNQSVAQHGLERYHALAAPDEETFIKQALLRVGFEWRFTPAASAAATTDFMLHQPLIDHFTDLRYGGNYLLVFDAPQSVVWLGRRFAAWTAKPELRTAGIVAQIVGYRALGLEDSARAATTLLRGESANPENTLAASEFDALPALLDSTQAVAGWPALAASLGTIARTDAATPLERGRAAWMLALLARRAHQDDQPWSARVRTGALAPFAALLDADSAAKHTPRAGIVRSQPLLALDSAGRAGDPFFRAVLHLLRAEWYARDNNAPSAMRELLWYGNYDIVGQPGSAIQSENADWSLGTFARWRRAALAPDTPGRELCRDLHDVARLWSGGDPPFRARADSAHARALRLKCAAA